MNNRYIYINDGSKSTNPNPLYVPPMSRNEEPDYTNIHIIKRVNEMYDVYNNESGKWIFSRISPDNVFSELSKMKTINLTFEDELIKR